MHEDSSEFAPPPTDRTTVAVFHRSFPLVVLLQLATCCAALIACIDGPALEQILDQPDWSPHGTAALVGALLAGGFIGGLVGLGQIGPWRGALKGICIGALIGLVMLCVYLAPAPGERVVAAAALVLLSTVFARWRSA